MIIMVSIAILLYGYLLFMGKYSLLPFEFKSQKDYKKVAKSIMLLGSFLLILSIFSSYKELDIMAIIMVIIIILLILIKILYSINLRK